MNIFKVSCLSDYGSYFLPYLQSVTMVARDKKHAIDLTRKWLKESGYNFIAPQEKWSIEDMGPIPEEGGMVDYNMDSDY